MLRRARLTWTSKETCLLITIMGRSSRYYRTPNGAALSSGGRRSEGRGATLPRLGNAQHGRSVPSLKSTQSQYDVSWIDAILMRAT